MPVNACQRERKGSLLTGLFSIFSCVPVVMMGYGWVFWLTVSFDPPGSRNVITPFQKAADNAAGLIVLGVYHGSFLVALLLIIGGFMIIWNRRRQIVSRIGIYISMICAVGAVIGSFLCIPIWMPWLTARSAFLLAVQMLLPVAGYVTCPLILLALLKKSGRSGADSQGHVPVK